MYVIGKTGTGKSTLLETMIRQDIGNNQGVALFDPHGDLVERVLAWVPERRKRDLIYFNVPDTARPLGFNPLESVPPAKRPLAASGMLEVFKKIWADSWGPRSEHILRNALLALLDQPKQLWLMSCGSSMTQCSEKMPPTKLRIGKFGISGSGNMRATRPGSERKRSRRFRTKLAHS